MKEQNEGLSLILRHIPEPWWEEPVLLYIRLSGKPGTLIKQLQKEVPEDIFHAGLMFLGKYAESLEEWNKLPGEFTRVLPFEAFDAFAIAKAGNGYAARVFLSESFKDQPDFPAKSWVSIIQGKKDRSSLEGKKFERWLDRANKDKMLVSSLQGKDLLMFMYLSLGAYEKVDTEAISFGPGNTKGLWLKDFAGFQKTPQFKAVVKNMNFLPYWQARGFPPGCRAVGRDDFECGR